MPKEQIPWDSPKLREVGGAMVREAAEWKQVGAAASHELEGLGDDDLTSTFRRTFVSRHDLPDLGYWEIPLAAVVGIGLGGTGEWNGEAARIISDDPVTLAVVNLGGFWTCQVEGTRYVRWQKWITAPAPGWRWCRECDRTIPDLDNRMLCEHCWPVWRDHPTYRQPEAVAALYDQPREQATTLF